MRIASSIAQAVAEGNAGALFAAGRTILRPGLPQSRELIDISRLRELDGVTLCSKGRELHLGALTKLETLRRHPLVRERNPSLAALLGYVGGTGVRTLATLGGNIGWGSGDLAPLLLAYQAVIESASGERTIDGRELEALILRVRLPREPAIFVHEKVGFREAFSPSLITVAAAAHVVHGRLKSVRVTAGGGPTPVQRLKGAEALIEGVVAGTTDWNAFRAAIRASLTTRSDDFASAAHRADVAGRVLATLIGDAFA